LLAPCADNLERIQRTSEELQQSINDIVAALLQQQAI